MSDSLKVIHKRGERKSGRSPQPSSYVLWDEVVEGFSEMRPKNTKGYGFGDNMNLEYGNRTAVTGAQVPYAYQTGNRTKSVRPDERTNCCTSTCNALAIALSTGSLEDEALYPVLGGRLLPADFYVRWNIVDESDPEWFMGPARAIQKHNLGERVKGHLVFRGDGIQMQWTTTAGGGHTVFCYHARRITATRTHFLFLSAQIDTNGIGVRINPWSVAAKAARDGKTKEATRRKISGEVKDLREWVEHAEEYAKEGCDSPAFVRRAIPHGCWYVANDSDKAGSAKATGAYYRAHVARPNAPFPAFPLSIRGQRSPALLRHDPAAPGDGPTPTPLTKREAFDAYYASNEGATGGFYPIGANRIWHGGVHLAPTGNNTVYAAFDGQVVCARLTPQGKGPFGSRAFVLLKHALKIDNATREFYTLYAHLDEAPDAPDRLEPWLRYPWIRDVVLAPEPDSPEAKLDWKKLYLKVTTLEDPPANPKKKGAKPRVHNPKIGSDPLAVGDILEFDPMDRDEVATWTKFWLNHQEKAKRVHPSAGSGKLTDLPETGLEAVDGYLARFAKKKKSLLEGKVVNFWDDAIVVRAGEPIGRLAEGVKGLHFELFSEQLIPCWTDKITVDDADANLFVDRKKFGEQFFAALDQGIPDLKDVKDHLVDGSAKKGDGVLTRAEVIAFYNANPDARQFRDIVARFPSEWSDEAKWSDFDKNAKKLSLGFLSDAKLSELKSLIEPYVWWDAKLESTAGLPGSKVVVHYNPLRFMEWIDDLREKEAAGGKDAPLHESVLELNHDRVPAEPT